MIPPLLERAPSVERISTIIPRREILASATSFVQETQRTFMTEDSLLQRHFAQIYRELSERRMRMRQLQLVIEQSMGPDKHLMLAPNCGVIIPEEPANTVLDREQRREW